MTVAELIAELQEFPQDYHVMLNLKDDMARAVSSMVLPVMVGARTVTHVVVISYDETLMQVLEKYKKTKIIEPTKQPTT